MRKRILVTLTLLFAFAVTLCFAGPSMAEVSAKEADAIEEILDSVQNRHISKPDPDALVRGAIEGLIDTLGDPYTQYFSKEQLKSFKGSLDGEYVGVGIQLQPGERYPKVLDIFRGTPADAAGIKPGDLVIKVDGVEVSEEPLGKVVQRIRGPEGTEVRLTIRREGMEDFEAEMSRANINMPTVTGKMLEDGIGYVKITSFGTHTAGEFQKSLDDLTRQGAKGLILDLRDNPGGILQTAVRITGNFVESGRVVVSVVDRNGKRIDYRTADGPKVKGVPVVALVNQNSASASEILAGALQDYGIATVVGDRTYGKGTVQEVIPLKVGGALKLTSARYHTPKDRVIDGTGLSPDIQVLAPELHLAVAQRILKRSETNTLAMEIGKPEALVNGTAVQLRHTALQRLDAVYLPLRFTFEALGYQVYWQEDANSIKVTGGNYEIIFTPGEGRVTLGGEIVTAAEPLLFEDGAAFIPVSVLGLLNIDAKIDESKVFIEK